MVRRSWAAVCQAGQQLVLMFLLTYWIMVALNSFYAEEQEEEEGDSLQARSKRLQERGSASCSNQISMGAKFRYFPDFDF